MANDNAQVSSEYVRLFFNDIEQLNDFTATYKNVLVEIRAKVDYEQIKSTASKMDTEEKKRLWFQAQTVRYLVTRIDIKLYALSKKIPEFKTIDYGSLEKLRDEIRDQSLPEFSDVEKYSKEINVLFVTGIASQFLEGSGQGYSSFVSGNQNEGTDETK